MGQGYFLFTSPACVHTSPGAHPGPLSPYQSGSATFLSLHSKAQGLKTEIIGLAPLEQLVIA